MTNRLLLGSGQWKWDGWVTVDADPANHPDILAVFPPLPEAVRIPNYWDEMLASHVIEHVSLPEAKILLAQCYECLTPGGKLTLDLPDISYCMRVALGLIEPPPGRSKIQFGLQGVFGAQDGNPWNGHRWGYDPISMWEMLEEAGFDPSKFTVGPGKYHEPIRDFLFEAVK